MILINGINDAVWIPTPLFILIDGQGVEIPFVYIASEFGVFISWLFLVLLITGKFRQLKPYLITPETQPAYFKMKKRITTEVTEVKSMPFIL